MSCSDAFLASDAGNAIVVGPDETPYVAGTTYAADFPLENAFQWRYAYGVTAFVTASEGFGGAASPEPWDVRVPRGTIREIDFVTDQGTWML